MYDWPPELNAHIVEMRLEGQSWQEIGAVINRPESAVKKHYTMSLDPALHRGWTPKKLELLNTYVAEGKSWRIISEDLMMSLSACREKWAKSNPELVMQMKQEKSKMRKQDNHNENEQRVYVPRPLPEAGLVALRRHKWSDHLDAWLLELRNRGLNWRQIGTTFGVTPVTCYTRYNQVTKLKANGSWTPPKLDVSNTPNYLHPGRRGPPAASALLTSNASNTGDNSSANARKDESRRETGVEAISTPQPLVPFERLGVVHEHIIYNPQESTSVMEWTLEEDTCILKSHEAGRSFNDIGAFLKIDPKLCSDRYYAYLDPALKDREWNSILSEKLLFYVQQGVSWPSIAIALGISRAFCQEKYRALMGLPTLVSSPPSPSPSAASSQAGFSDQNVQDVSCEITTVAAGQSADEVMNQEFESVTDTDDFYDDEDDQSVGIDNDDGIEDLDADDSDGDDGDDGADDDFDEANDDDDMLDEEAQDLGEGLSDEPLHMGRNSRWSKSIVSTQTTAREKWDDSAVMREIKKTWSPTDETTLIQHVLRKGTRGWQEVSDALQARHSPEECRAYWKHLDIPVYRPPEGLLKWDMRRAARFWQAWVENGPDFDDVSNAINQSLAEMEIEGLNRNASQQEYQKELPMAAVFSPEDCADFFHQQTKSLRQSSGGDEEKFYQDCIEMALARSVIPTFTWDKELSVRLQKLVRLRLRTRGMQVNWINWRWVARLVGGGVTPQRCNLHWRTLRMMDMHNTNWTEEEILLLEQGIREVGPLFNQAKHSEPDSITFAANLFSENDSEPTLAGFAIIQKFFLPDRSIKALQQKYFTLSDKASRVTLREYMAIMDAVDEHGEDQWDKVVESVKSGHALSSISSLTGTEAETGLSGWTKAPCRRVWEASYRYLIRNTQWTLEEDEDLKISVEKAGQGNWVGVSRYFPGKSAWQCRLRWCQLTDPLQAASL
ncbi:Myblike DNAbinding domain-containing protein [Mortierella claussenii]|nr:Myblike DNAbinding domain-containing protein [Mortierella claussenii]